jgi:hypothetical protein
MNGNRPKQWSTALAQKEIAARLGLPTAHIEVLCEDYLRNQGQGCWNGYVHRLDGPDFFFKAAAATDGHHQLHRESEMMQQVARLGIPTAGLAAPTMTTPQGLALLVQNRIDLLPGATLLSTRQDLSRAPHSFAKAAARTLHAVSGIAMPALNETFPRKRDPRNDSLQTFWQTFQHQNQVVFTSLAQPGGALKPLAALVASCEQSLRHLFASEATSKGSYFVHNDTNYHNINYQRTPKGVNAILLDFGESDVIASRLLARLGDFSDHWGQLWSNPPLQHSFATEYYRITPEPQKAKTAKMIRSAMINGSMFLAKYAMAPEHEEHAMSVALLANLASSLAAFNLEVASTGR